MRHECATEAGFRPPQRTRRNSRPGNTATPRSYPPPPPPPPKELPLHHHRRAAAPRIAAAGECAAWIALDGLHAAEEQVEIPEPPDRPAGRLERGRVDAGLRVHDAILEVNAGSLDRR